MPFVKLDCRLLESSLWEDIPGSRVFLTCAMMATPFVTELPMQAYEVQTLTPMGWEVPPDFYGLVNAALSGIARKAMLSKEDVTQALVRLCAPDPESSSPAFEGRRLARVDGGYLVLNYGKYREFDLTGAERVRRWRRKKTATVTRNVTPVTPLPSASASVPIPVLPVQKGMLIPISLVPQSGTTVESEVKKEHGEKHNARYHKDTRVALHWLNDKGGRHYREVDANLKVISARLSETGVTVEGVKQMIDRQVARWKGTPQEEYLRPETLFAKSKFDGYYAARELPIEQQRNGQSIWELNKRAERLQEVLANHRANPEGIYGGQPTTEQRKDFVNLTHQLEQLKREIATHEPSR